MWQDEPIEIKLGRQKALQIAAFLYAIAFVALLVTIITNGQPALIMLATPAVCSFGLSVIGVESIKARIIKQRAEDFPDLDPLPVHVSVIQNDILTGHDKALVWLKDGRLFIEGVSLSMSLVTSDFSHQRIGNDLGIVNLRYGLEDRILEVRIGANDRGGQHRLEDIYSEWISSEPAEGDSFLPLGIQHSLTIPSEIDLFYKAWCAATFILAAIAIFIYAEPPVLFLSLFGLWAAGAALALRLVRNMERSTDQRLAKIQEIAELNNRSGLLTNYNA